MKKLTRITFALLMVLTLALGIMSSASAECNHTWSAAYRHDATHHFGVCTKCGITEKEQALRHESPAGDDDIALENMLHTEDCQHKGVCSVCSATGVTFAKTAHHLTGGFTDDTYHWSMCSYCGIVNKEKHKFRKIDETDTEIFYCCQECGTDKTVDKTATIQMSPVSAKRGVGESFTIYVKVNGEALSLNASWSSSNNAVATVSSYGEVTPLKPGTARITAKLNNTLSASCDVTVTKAPSVITVSPTTYVEKGSTATIKMAYGTGESGSYTVTSSKPAVATAKKATATTWTVTGKAVGVTNFTFTSYNGKKAVCKVGVYDKLPTKVTLNATNVKRGIGNNFVLTAKTDSKPIATPVTFKSSNARVAKVDSKGNVTLLAKGSAVITATSVNGKTATCNITVTAAPTKITATPTSLTIAPKAAATIKMAYGTGESGSYTFASSDTSVATVQKTTSTTLTVTGKKAGTAVITLKSYNGITVKVKVTVK